MTAHWYTLRVKPHKERMVYGYLTSKKVESYLPLVKVNPVNPRAAKYKPYFPGYIFVWSDLDVEGANSFNWTPGAQHLVSFDGIPAIVPDAIVDQLKTRLAEIADAGGLVFDNLSPGDKVKITSGPFAGFEAVFNARLSGKERVEVFLAFLSQHPQSVKLNASDIDKI